MLPDAPTGEKLKSDLFDSGFMQGKALREAFTKLRADADEWHAARTAFMTGQLENGRHPDTDPNFWDGYTERPAPGLPTINARDEDNASRPFQWLTPSLVITIVVLAAGVVAALLAVRSAKARRRAALLVKDKIDGEAL